VLANGLPASELMSLYNKTQYILLAKITGVLVFAWFLSQDILGVYRVINAGFGYEYPGSVIIWSNDPISFPGKYDWNITPYQAAFQSKKPNVWISAYYQLEEFLDLELSQDANLVTSALSSGYSPELSSVKPTNQSPDFLLVTKDRLPILDARLKQNIINENQMFILIKPPDDMMGKPYIVGFNSYNDGQAIMSSVNEHSGLDINGGTLEYYSPINGNVELTINIFAQDLANLSKNPISVKSIPGGVAWILNQESNPITLHIASQRGLNIIQFNGTPIIMQLLKITCP
jgi:hypothetical protein